MIRQSLVWFYPSTSSRVSSWVAALNTLQQTPLAQRTGKMHLHAALTLLSSITKAKNDAQGLWQLRLLAPLRWECGRLPSPQLRATAFRDLIIACVQASEQTSTRAGLREPLASAALLTLNEAAVFAVPVTSLLLKPLLSSAVLAAADRTLLPDVAAFYASRAGSSWTPRDEKLVNLSLGVGYAKRNDWQLMLRVLQNQFDGFLLVTRKLSLAAATRVCASVVSAGLAKQNVSVMVGCCEVAARLSGQFPRSQWSRALLLPLLRDYQGPRLPMVFMAFFVASIGQDSLVEQEGLELYDKYHQKACFNSVMGHIMRSAVVTRQWRRALDLFASRDMPASELRQPSTWRAAFAAATGLVCGHSTQELRQVEECAELLDKAPLGVQQTFLHTVLTLALKVNSSRAEKKAVIMRIAACSATAATAPDARVALSLSAHLVLWGESSTALRLLAAPAWSSVISAALRGFAFACVARRDYAALATAAQTLCRVPTGATDGKLCAAAALIALNTRCDLTLPLAASIRRAPTECFAPFAKLLKNLVRAVRIEHPKFAADVVTPEDLQRNADSILAALMRTGTEGLVRLVSESEEPVIQSLAARNLAGGWAEALEFMLAIPANSTTASGSMCVAAEAGKALVNCGYVQNEVVEFVLRTSEAAALEGAAAGSS
jgi:hypothetical protein